MARLFPLIAVGLALAASPPVLGWGELTLIPPAESDADRNTKPDERGEAIRRAVDEHLEVSRLVQNDPSPLPRALLEKTDRKLKRLHQEQPVGEQAKEADDPSDIYFQGWLLTRDAEKLKIAGKLADCREKLESAMKLFERVTMEHPDWKPPMVQGRLKRTKDELSSLPSASNPTRRTPFLAPL